MRKTKIICTLGPASETEQVLREMIEAGMNVARFNFSHGSHEEHLKRLKLVKKLRKEMDVSLGALLDTKGPEIRLGKIEGGKTVLKDGDPFTLTTEQIVGDNTRASVSFQDLTKDVKEGDRILIDDGLIELPGAEGQRQGNPVRRAQRRPHLRPQGRQRAERRAVDAVLKRQGPRRHQVWHRGGL